MSAEKRWKGYFVGFTYPWLFYGVEMYKELISRAGLADSKGYGTRWKRIAESVGAHSFLPYTARLAEALRDNFIKEVASAYVRQQPPDEIGRIHVQMVRLEVEATL